MRRGWGLLRQKKDAFGLDIGSSAIKLVHLGERPAGYELRAFAIVNLPPDAVGDGTINDPAMVADAIREAVGKAGVKGKDAVVGISGQSVIMKKISLPRVDPKDLGDAIPLEAEHHIPFPIDDVYLDYQVVGGSRGEGELMDVMLVAVRKAKADQQLDVVRKAKLNPVVVDLDALALENQFEVNHPDLGEEVVALIDIGASVMKTNVIRGGAPIFARDTTFGGHDYTRAIAQRLDIPSDRAEAAKCGQGVAGVSWDDLVPSLEATSRELSLEIQRNFDYLTSLAESEHISRVVLSGGCAKLPGIVPFLSAGWGIPVEVVTPFRTIHAPADRFPADVLEAAAPMLAVAVGLGIRRPGDRPA